MFRPREARRLFFGEATSKQGIISNAKNDHFAASARWQSDSMIQQDISLYSHIAMALAQIGMPSIEHAGVPNSVLFGCFLSDTLFCKPTSSQYVGLIICRTHPHFLLP